MSELRRGISAIILCCSIEAANIGSAKTVKSVLGRIY